MYYTKLYDGISVELNKNIKRKPVVTSFSLCGDYLTIEPIYNPINGDNAYNGIYSTNSTHEIIPSQYDPTQC